MIVLEFVRFFPLFLSSTFMHMVMYGMRNFSLYLNVKEICMHRITIKVECQFENNIGNPFLLEYALLSVIEDSQETTW